MTLPDRIVAKIDADLAGCWRWTGAIERLGYGRVRWEGRSQLAHRVVYGLLVGPIPEGLTLDHLCRNRACVRPSHLEPVTLQENIMRGDTMQARHAAKTQCPSGHPYDAANTVVFRGSRYCRACQKRRAHLRSIRKATTREAAII